MLSARVAADAVTLAATVSALEKGQQWRQGLALLFQCAAASVKVNCIGLSAAISACEKAGQWEAACEMLRYSVMSQIQVDTVVFSAAIAACSSSGQWVPAVRLLEEMGRVQICRDAVACTAAATACANAAEWQGAIALLGLMLAEQVPTGAIIYTAVLSACDAAERWEEAVTLMENMISRALDVDGVHVGCAVSAMLKRRGRPAAIRLLKALRSSWPSATQEATEVHVEGPAGLKHRVPGFCTRLFLCVGGHVCGCPYSTICFGSIFWAAHVMCQVVSKASRCSAGSRACWSSTNLLECGRKTCGFDAPGTLRTKFGPHNWGQIPSPIITPI